jgi:hypothetical protein
MKRLPVCLLVCGVLVLGQHSFAASSGVGSTQNAAVMTILSGVIPHIAMGGPWHTTVVVTNHEARFGNEVVLKFYTPDGTDLPVNLVGDLPQNTTVSTSSSEFRMTLQPLQTVVAEVTPKSDPDRVQTGWMVLEGEVNKVARCYTIYKGFIPGQLDLESIIPPSFPSPYVNSLPFDNRNGYVTSIAMVNNFNMNPIEVVVDVLDVSGTVIATYSETIGPRNQMAFETPRLWPATENRFGIIRMQPRSSVIAFAAIGLLFSPKGSMTAVPLTQSY